MRWYLRNVRCIIKYRGLFDWWFPGTVIVNLSCHILTTKTGSALSPWTTVFVTDIISSLEVVSHEPSSIFISEKYFPMIVTDWRRDGFKGNQYGLTASWSINIITPVYYSAISIWTRTYWLSGVSADCILRHLVRALDLYVRLFLLVFTVQCIDNLHKGFAILPASVVSKLKSSKSWLLAAHIDSTNH